VKRGTKCDVIRQLYDLPLVIYGYPFVYLFIYSFVFSEMETSRIQSHSGNNGKNINEENEDGESITEKRKILDPDAIGSDTRSSGHDTIAATTTTTTTLVPFDSTGRPSLFVTTALAHLKEGKEASRIW